MRNCKTLDLKFRALLTECGTKELARGVGTAYYAPPGHVFEALEDTETVEFSPKEPLEQTLEAVGKNLEAMGES